MQSTSVQNIAQSVHDAGSYRTYSLDVKTLKRIFHGSFNDFRKNDWNTLLHLNAEIFSERLREYTAEYRRQVQENPHKKSEFVPPIISGLDGSTFEWKNLDLSYVGIKNSDFSRCRLTRCIFNFTTFYSNTYFEHSKLIKCSFTSSTLNEVHFSNSTFLNCDFWNSDLNISYLNDCDMQKTSFMNSRISGCIFGRSIISSGNFSSAIISNSSSFDYAVLKKNCNFRDAQIRDSSLNQSRINNCDFRNATISDGTIFTYSIIENSNFGASRIVNSNFTQADLCNSKFLQAVIQDVSFNEALFNDLDLRDVKKIENISLRFAVFSNSYFPFDKLPFVKEEVNRDYLGAESVYRILKNCATAQGDHHNLSFLAFKEKQMKRFQVQEKLFKRAGKDNNAEKISVKNWIPLFFEYIGYLVWESYSMYGEAPLRVFGAAFIVVLIYSFIYSLTGIAQDDVIHRFDYTHSFQSFFKYLYYSSITFTTVGYGDIRPVGTLSRFLAMSEGFLGVFTAGYFIFCLGRKVGAR